MPMTTNTTTKRKRGITGDELEALRERMTGQRARAHLDAVMSELEAIRTKPPRIPAWAKRRGVDELRQIVALMEAQS